MSRLARVETVSLESRSFYGTPRGSRDAESTRDRLNGLG